MNRLYSRSKNNKFIKEYVSDANHNPIAIDDLIGDLLISEEGFAKEQSDATKYILNSVAKYGLTRIPKKTFLKMPKLMLKYKMTVEQVTNLYTKYIGNWGESAVEYRFEAIQNGEVVKSIVKAPMKKAILQVNADHTKLVENHTYDVALVQIKMVSEHGNILPYCHEPIFLETEGPIEIIGPKCITLQGGMFGTYVKSVGAGNGKLTLKDTRGNVEELHFQVEKIGE